MTREEFREQVTSIYDIADFCSDNGFEWFVEEYVWEDSLNECVEEDIREFLQSDYWFNLDLDSIERGYDCYKREGMLDYREVDFATEVELLENQLDEEGFFDEDSDEDVEDMTIDEFIEKLVCGKACVKCVTRQEVLDVCDIVKGAGGMKFAISLQNDLSNGYRVWFPAKGVYIGRQSTIGRSYISTYGSFGAWKNNCDNDLEGFYITASQLVEMDEKEECSAFEDIIDIF